MYDIEYKDGQRTEPAAGTEPQAHQSRMAAGTDPLAAHSGINGKDR